MEDNVVDFRCKRCGLLWSREFADDCVNEIKRINMTMEECPACIYSD